MPSQADIAALAEKYRRLGDMRRRELEGHAPLADAIYQRLARGFPGALKELDQLALEEIDRRREALERAETSGNVERWMVVVHRYHALLRTLLETRRAISRPETRGSVRLVEAAASLVAVETRVPLEEVQVLLALRPSRG